MLIYDETVMKYGDQQILIRCKDCYGKLGDKIDITYNINISNISGCQLSFCKNLNAYSFIIYLKYEIGGHRMIEVYGNKVGLRYNLFVEKYYNERNFVDV